MIIEPARLEYLRKLCDEASPGPWSFEQTPQFRCKQSITDGDGDNVVVGWWQDDGDTDGGLAIELEDVDFILNARQAMPVLIDELERVTAERDAMLANPWVQVVQQREAALTRVAKLEGLLSKAAKWLVVNVPRNSDLWRLRDDIAYALSVKS